MPVKKLKRTQEKYLLKMKQKISVVISAHNEESRIEACLDSVKWADEIIVVDNSSSDKTAEIARKYTDKVYLQPNDPLKIDLQKNAGFEKATGDFILSLDADERVLVVVPIAFTSVSVALPVPVPAVTTVAVNDFISRSVKAANRLWTLLAPAALIPPSV